MDSFSIMNEAASTKGSTPDQSNDNYDQFFKAAADGNIEPFKKIAQQLHRIVTPLKNTVLHINITSDPSKIDPDQFLNAAADGNIKPFNKQIAEQLNLIVTPIKNTVLHINITSEKVLTEFVEEILGICPSLLLQVNAQGDTPLHVAAKFEHVAIMEVLIKHAKAQHAELESGVGAGRQMIRITNNKGKWGTPHYMRLREIKTSMWLEY
ncbi:hypothetical protein QYF36_019831 [Acer negundo]|nr:hypothetical protein QYF36_019831 [Acer negundo]